MLEDSGEADRQNLGAKQRGIEALPYDAIEFLIASRYCEVDRMTEVAWQLFGAVPAGWPRVQAVCDYVHGHLRFDYLQARSTRTAYEAYQERVGVCRDFAHLAVTLCRCLNVPARYCTGYLGDIAVTPVPAPMDFSAWFEVYLDEHVVHDGREAQRAARRAHSDGPRPRRRGRGATSFGASRLDRFTVWCDEVGPEAALPAQARA